MVYRQHTSQQPKTILVGWPEPPIHCATNAMPRRPPCSQSPKTQANCIPMQTLLKQKSVSGSQGVYRSIRWGAIHGRSLPLRAREKYGEQKSQLCALGSSLPAKVQPFCLQHAIWQLIEYKPPSPFRRLYQSSYITLLPICYIRKVRKNKTSTTRMNRMFTEKHNHFLYVQRAITLIDQLLLY